MKTLLFITRGLPRYNGSTVYSNDMLTFLSERNVNVVVAVPIETDHFCCFSSHPYLLKGKGYFFIGGVYLPCNVHTLVIVLRRALARCVTDKIDPKRKIVSRIKAFFNKINNLGNHSLSDASGISPETSLFEYTKGERIFIAEIYNEVKPDVVMFDFIWTIPLLEELNLDSSVLTILFCHDVLHKRAEMIKDNGLLLSNCFYCNKEHEIECFSKMDGIIAIQKEEALYLSEILPDKKVFLSPFSTAAFPVSHGYSRKACDGRILFIGGSSDHNVVGIKWFLDKCWQKIKRDYPHAHLVVCGFVCDYLKEYECDEALQLLGALSDIDSVYSSAVISIVPLVFGSGLKTKIMESLAYQCPVVSTTIGIQGIADPARYGISVADAPDVFADKVVGMLQNINGNQYLQYFENFKNDFSAETCYGDLLNYIIRKNV